MDTVGYLNKYVGLARFFSEMHPMFFELVDETVVGLSTKGMMHFWQLQRTTVKSAAVLDRHLRVPGISSEAQCLAGVQAYTMTVVKCSQQQVFSDCSHIVQPCTSSSSCPLWFYFRSSAVAVLYVVLSIVRPPVSCTIINIAPRQPLECTSPKCFCMAIHPRNF